MKIWEAVEQHNVDTFFKPPCITRKVHFKHTEHVYTWMSSGDKQRWYLLKSIGFQVQQQVKSEEGSRENYPVH